MTESRPSALRDLIQSRLADLDLSYGDVARRGRIPKATVANLASGDLSQVPRPETIVGLARGLELPVSSLQAAIAEAVGLAPAAGRDRTTDLIVRTLDELDDAQRRQVAALVSAMRKEKNDPP